MSLFDDSADGYGNVANNSYALDSSAALANQPSVFDSIGNVVAKFVPLTGLAVANSFYNTGVNFLNYFGADIPEAKAQDQLDSLGWSDYSSYYTAHAQGIEAAGLIGGSFIPGLAAVKAIRVMQAGKFGSLASRATNLLMSPTDKILESTVATIESGEGALFPSLQADKIKAVALGFRDQAVQSLAWETATLATMNQSPLLKDDSWQNITSDLFWGTLTGGMLGGAIEGAITYGRFKKAYVLADANSKVNELTTNVFSNNDITLNNTPLAGDKVNLLLDSLDRMPAPTTQTGARKQSDTVLRAVTEVKSTLQALTKGGDEDVANSVADMIINGKQLGNMSKEDTAMMLSGLAKISRIGEPPTMPQGTEVYVGRYVKGNLADPRSIQGALTNEVVDAADVTRKYIISPYSTGVKIGTFNQTFLDQVGNEFKRYTNSEEAFNDGMDMFWNSKLQMIVNPKSENLTQIPLAGESRITTGGEQLSMAATGRIGAKPLFGAPLVVNTLTGDMKSSAIAVPGDFGRVRVVKDTVEYGQNERSFQGVSKPLTTETPTIDASARYIWANTRGILKNDEIVDSDLPMLTAMHNEATASGDYAAHMQKLEDRGVTFESGDDLPSSPAEMLTKIQSEKDSFISDLISKNPKMSSEEVARRANVSEDYIANGFQAAKDIDYMQPVENLSRVNHAQMEYDIGNTHVLDGQVVRGLVDSSYRIQLLQDVAETAFAKHFGQDYEQGLAGKYTSADATIEGARPGLLTFSNAARGSLGQRTEGMGRFLTNFNNSRMSAISTLLSPVFNLIRGNTEVAAELGFFNAVRRSTSESYSFLPEDLVKQYMPSVDNTTGVAVLTNSLKRDKNLNILDWNSGYKPEGFMDGLSKADLTAAKATQSSGLKTWYELHPDVENFERIHMQINDARIKARNDWYTAQGLGKELPVGTLYAPPIDTGKYPHFALVRPVTGKAFSDDSTQMIVASTAEGLQAKIASLRDDFDVFTKDMLKKYHEVEGDYDYQRNFNGGLVNSELRRRGVLSDVFPDTAAETILRDYIDFHNRQEIRINRDYMELGNQQLFTELRDIGNKYTATETSQTKWWSAMLGKQAENPYDSYIKTALAIRQEPYKLWMDAQEQVESFAGSAFKVAKSAFIGVQKGLLDVDQASAMAERMGLGNPYKKAVDEAQAYYQLANQLPPQRLLTKFVNTANAMLSATAIRLDFFQSLVTVASGPIMAASEMLSARSALVKEISSVALPGTSGITLPSVTKLLAAGIKDWFDPTLRNGEWGKTLTKLGILRDSSNDYFKAIEAAELPLGKAWSESAIVKKMSDMVELGSKITGAQASENFMRFTVAMAARRLYEAAGYTGVDLLDQITTTVNRVHGNYIASQRPTMFQGPIGSAMGLFQTYQLNLFQQLFKYVQDGEAKTLMLFGALQGGMFGLQGLPGMAMINQHLIGNAASNPAHKDLYGTTVNAMDKPLGDWLLYGALSNVTRAGLYSRGDINPRSLSVIPLNPLDFPAVSGAVNFITSLYNTASKVANGGQLWTSLLQGMEHNGLSRPLSGLGQLMQGFTTTSQGNFVSLTRPNFSDNTLGWNDMFNISNFSRVLGARPLDEAITMDALYRHALYQAKDVSRIQDLGSAAKTYLTGNQPFPEGVVQDFSSKYAASGGYMPSFGREIMSWTKDANASKANEIFLHLDKPINKQMQMIMGGQRLPDYYYNNPSVVNAEMAATPQ